MADVELVIKIPKEVYEDIKDSNIIFRDDERTCYESVQNGIPLPKGHGRLIDADKLVYWECNGDCDMCCDDDKCGMVKEAQTIIEADKEI